MLDRQAFRRYFTTDEAACGHVDRAADRHADAGIAAAPFKAAMLVAEQDLREAERAATTERLRQSLEQMSWEEPNRTLSRSRDKSLGIEL